jgi:hypothetical protein
VGNELDGVPGLLESARMKHSSARFLLGWPIRGLIRVLRGSPRVDVESQSCAGKIPVESYMITARGLAVAGVCLLLSAVMVARTPQAASGHELSGVYAVQQAADAGTNVKLTLHAVLTSSTDMTLQATGVSLRSVLSSTTQDLSASLSIPPHGNADFTAEVVITGAEYKLWQEGGKPLLVLQLRSSDGTSFTRIVALLPAVRAEAK